jgi:hypothetical protein
MPSRMQIEAETNEPARDDSLAYESRPEPESEQTERPMSKTLPAAIDRLVPGSRYSQRPHLVGTALLSGKSISVRWTRRAYAALRERDTPLYVEMKLTLACLAKKEVFFGEEASNCPTAFVNDRLAVSMNVYIPAACAMRKPGATVEEPPGRCEPGAFTITPRWLKIDYSRGQWSGEYRI